MLLKLALILVLICVLIRWALGKWPWQYLDGRPTRAQALVNARRLLKVEHGASREQILAAHKRLIASVHPDRGGSNAQVHEANDARDLLLAELPAIGVPNRNKSDDDTHGGGASQD